jgi:peptide-methionine (S)-S-oxide reductase
MTMKLSPVATLRLVFFTVLASFALAGSIAFAKDRSFPGPEPIPPRHATAVFAGGCFWCVEHDFEAIPGVVSAQSGYTGGRTPRPSYEDVVTETTGHYEAVRVVYDPAQISYRQLVDRFWRLVDPTDGGGQFCDRGESYRTAIWVSNPAERTAAEASRSAVTGLRLQTPIVTPILDATTFWPAEVYHQGYAEKNALAYRYYRTGCGRDARLGQVWGPRRS